MPRTFADSLVKGFFSACSLSIAAFQNCFARPILRRIVFSESARSPEAFFRLRRNSTNASASPALTSRIGLAAPKNSTRLFCVDPGLRVVEPLPVNPLNRNDPANVAPLVKRHWRPPVPHMPQFLGRQQSPVAERRVAPPEQSIARRSNERRPPPQFVPLRAAKRIHECPGMGCTFTAARFY
ncbi:MAG: hypothetical protein KF774_03170 [Planctomyces sp.]|nr:hypothetical protein [Planctomyces sp.]